MQEGQQVRRHPLLTGHQDQAAVLDQMEMLSISFQAWTTSIILVINFFGITWNAVIEKQRRKGYF